MLHKNPFSPLINLNPRLDKVDIYIYIVLRNYVEFCDFYERFFLKRFILFQNS